MLSPNRLAGWALNQATGFRECYRILEAGQWKGPHELEGIQSASLTALVDYAHDRLPYYRNLFERAGITGKVRTADDFARVPVSTKRMIRNAYPKEIYIRRSFLDSTSRTSGSTGEPFECIIDGRTHGWRIATKYLFDSWMGVEPDNRWIRLFGHANWATRVRARILHQEKLIPIELLAGKGFVKMVKILNGYAPIGLSGISSSLVMLARRLKEAEAHFTSNLRGVFSTAEMLHDHQRDIIASTLSPNVFDRYGLREFGGYLAQECEYHNGLHLNSLLVYAEIIRNGERASPGEVGKLIVTDLRNYAMPLIRYDTGDVASIELGCECGRAFPLIRHLEGRESDFIRTKVGWMPARTVTTKFGIEFLEYVRAFQFIQDETAKVVVKVVPAHRLDASLARRLAHFLENYLDDFEVSFVDDIPPENSGKRPMFKSPNYRG